MLFENDELFSDVDFFNHFSGMLRCFSLRKYLQLFEESQLECKKLLKWRLPKKSIGVVLKFKSLKKRNKGNGKHYSRHWINW